MSLSPVVDAINEVRSGVDKTAAELALERIQKELSTLVFERAKFIKSHPYPRELSMLNLILLIIVGFLLVILSIELFSDSEVAIAGIFCLLPGILLMFLGIQPILKKSTKR